MNVYNEAHNLAQAIKECDETKQYKEMKEKLDAKPELASAVADFMNHQMELQYMQMQGQEPDEHLMGHIQELYGILMSDPLAADYMQAEMRLSIMMNDVYKIIGEAIGAVEPAPEQ